MAKIQSSGNVPFDSYHLNLDAVFAGTTTAIASNNGPLTQAATREVIGFSVFNLPAHDLHVTTLVRLTNDRDVSQSLMGNSFVFDDGGALVSGTISLLWGPSDSFLQGVSVLGLSLDVAEFLAVAGTRGSWDDARMMLRAFAGNDLVDGGFYDDVFAMGSGKDKIDAGYGNDRVQAGAGNDWVNGGGDNDTVYGGGGHDVLIGEDGSDQLFGGWGRDSLLGQGYGAGFDTLTGGLGGDRFVFDVFLGHVTITDFQDGRDKLALHYVVTDWRDLTLTQEGADARISHSTGWVLLQNVDVADLTGRDFLIDTNEVERGQIAFMTGWDYLV